MVWNEFLKKKEQKTGSKGEMNNISGSDQVEKNLKTS